MNIIPRLIIPKNAICSGCKNYKSTYWGYPQTKSWKIITGSAGGMFLTARAEDPLHAEDAALKSRRGDGRLYPVSYRGQAQVSVLRIGSLSEIRQRLRAILRI